MNINPLGISAYDKNDVSRKNVDPAQQAQEQFAVETKKADLQRANKAEQDKSITIASRESATSSSLAVKAKADFTQLLSVEERDAIDLLFSKYTESQNTDSNYGLKGQQAPSARLGAKVDFRV